MESPSSSNSSDSDQSMEGSYYQVNPAQYSPDTETVQIVNTTDRDGDADSLMTRTTLDAVDVEEDTKTQLAEHQSVSQLTSLMSDRPLRRDDSVSSISSSIIFAPEDLVSTAQDGKEAVRDLRNTLANLNMSMFNSMSESAMMGGRTDLFVGTTRLPRTNSRQSVDKGNKKLEIQFTKTPQARDLDPIIVFFENKKASGGGDVLSVSELDNRNNILTIEFKSSLTKRRLLQKGVLTFRKHKFFVNEPIDKNAFSLDRSVMILTNVAEDEDAEVVQMFAENLVMNEDTSDDDDASIEAEGDDQDNNNNNNNSFQKEESGDNEVLEITKSTVFQEMFIAKFRKEFDMKTAQERLSRRPVLNAKRIQVIDAYKTNIVLVRDAKSQPLKARIEAITEHLTAIFKLKYQNSSAVDSGAFNWFSVRLVEPFLMVRLLSQDDVAYLLKKELVIDGRTYLTEYFCNYELFLSEVERLGTAKEVEDEETQATREPKADQATGRQVDAKVSVVQVTEKPAPDQAEVLPLDTKPPQQERVVNTLNTAEEESSEPPSQPEAEELEVGKSESVCNDEVVKTAEKPVEGAADKAAASSEQIERPWYDLDASVDGRVKTIIYWKELYMSSFLSQLTSIDSEVVLTGELFRIQCTLTSNDQAHQAHQAWLKAIKGKIDDFLDSFEYFKMPQPSGAESLVKKISYEKETVRVVLAQDAGGQRFIEVYGLKKAVQEFVAELMVCLRQHQTGQQDHSANRSDRGVEKSVSPTPEVVSGSEPEPPQDEQEPALDPNEKIREVIRDLQINQVRILYVYKYLKQIKDQFGDSVDVLINPSQGFLSLDGKRGDVTVAKQLALDMLSRIVTRELAVPEPERMLFFTKKEIAFVHWLREKKIKCALVPNPAQRALSINSLSEREIDSCINAIGHDIISLSIDCSLIRTQDERFNDFLDELRQESKNDFIFVDNIRTLNQFKLAGFRDQVNHNYKILLNKFTE